VTIIRQESTRIVREFFFEKRNSAKNQTPQVLTTGSKFYGGPPFSGAILMPLSLSKEIDESEHLTKELLGDFHVYMDHLLVSWDMPRLKGILKTCEKARVRAYYLYG
jgi:hypothetical protein